jgi:hypothetical protein
LQNRQWFIIKKIADENCFVQLLISNQMFFVAFALYPHFSSTLQAIILTRVLSGEMMK